MARALGEFAKLTQEEILVATLEIIRNPHIHLVFKKDFLKNNTIQLWSMHHQGSTNGKHVGNRYMSQGAYDQYMEKKSVEKLVHEHVTTKKLLYKHHFENHFLDVTRDELLYWLEACAFACVVTKIEDTTRLGGKYKQNLPDGFWQVGHPLYMKKWARYIHAGFTDIWEVEWEGKTPLKMGRPNFQETI